MPSLAVPPIDTSLSAETVMGFEAAELLADRARAIDKSFRITDTNARVVAEIVGRLDGMPLAIELAAARIKTLGILNVAKLLDRTFSILTGGSRAALPRQQTMRALIDWSYELLSESEKSVFRSLSTFRGGFTLDAAIRVCSSDSMEEFAVVDSLGSLVDKSLVQIDSGEIIARYRLLESTREYARDKLVGSGELAAATRAHATAFLAAARDFYQTWPTTPERQWFE